MKKHLAQISLMIALSAAVQVSAAELYYNPGIASGEAWSGSNYWSATGVSGPFDTNWVDNNTAVFAPPGSRAVELVGQTIAFGAAGGLKNTTNNTLTIRSTYGGSGILDFNGGTFQAAASNGGTTVMHASAGIRGNFTLTQGVLDMTSTLNTGVVSYSGTLTTSGGILFTGTSRFTSSSHLVNTGGTIYSEHAANYSIGSLRATGGNFYIGVLAASGTTNVTLGELSGAALGGNIQARINSSGNGLIHSLTVNQSTNTAYNGTLLSDNTSGSNVNYFTFTKSGSGTLSLGGNTIRLLQGTTVSGGTLLIDGLQGSSTRTFDNIAGGAGSAAITVKNGGALGGVSTMTILNGRRVVVEQGGGLVPGSDGAAGRTTFNFGATGGALDLTGAALGTGWLKFDLGSNATAGTTYDSIRLVASSGGALNIGTQLLNFDDFSFTALTGFNQGVYTLFALDGTATLNGSLGTSLTGLVAAGFYGTLSQSGNNIILTVIPEPTTTYLLGGAALMLLVSRLRRRGVGPVV